MKSRRVIVEFEIETDVSRAALERATIRVAVPGNIKYLEKVRVNVVRNSTTARKSRKEKAK